jgi:hypothetical protein
LQAGVWCFGDEDDGQDLIETVLFWGLRMVISNLVLEVSKSLHSTPGLLIFKIYPP